MTGLYRQPPFICTQIIFLTKKLIKHHFKMRVAILDSKRRSSCVHTTFGSYANVLTKIRAIIQHFQLQEKTLVKNSVGILHYSSNNCDWLFLSLLLHNVLAGLTSALASLSEQQEETRSPTAPPADGLFCTCSLDWNTFWDMEVWKMKKIALDLCIKRSLDKSDKKDTAREPSGSIWHCWQLLGLRRAGCVRSLGV